MLSKCWPMCSVYRELLHQQTLDVHPTVSLYWATVYDVGPTSTQHWIKVSCLLGILHLGRGDVSPKSVRLCESPLWSWRLALIAAFTRWLCRGRRPCCGSCCRIWLYSDTLHDPPAPSEVPHPGTMCPVVLSG